ncbi:hypothetical protein CEXT_158371 [Caerostris extrusa]|uniref:Uncharacterized protein n=1 Tax=Caerostris extrusa TaxID=172846 RepID=A0AAV4XFV7_CAEEX|nr:hypothetical protein CEXT_158371 [Caerostris extrusa]
MNSCAERKKGLKKKKKEREKKRKMSGFLARPGATDANNGMGKHNRVGKYQKSRSAKAKPMLLITVNKQTERTQVSGGKEETSDFLAEGPGGGEGMAGKKNGTNEYVNVF